MDVHVLHGTLKRTHLGDRHDRADVVERMAAALVQHDLVLVLLTRIAERGAEQEPVELRLGQEKGALLLDRVLGREQEERRGEPARDAVHGHLPLGHRLEERRLRLLGGAVDLVDEHDVGEDRPRPELEVARLLVEDRRARDVAGLQIGRALDPRRDRALDRGRDGAREHRLRRAGNVLEEHVTLAGERGEDERDLGAFAADDLLDAGVQPGGDLDRRRTRGFPARERLDASQTRPGIGGVSRAAGCGRWPPGRVVLVRHVDRVSLTGSARRRPCSKHTRLPAALHSGRSGGRITARPVIRGRTSDGDCGSSPRSSSTISSPLASMAASVSRFG